MRYGLRPVDEETLLSDYDFFVMQLLYKCAPLVVV